MINRFSDVVSVQYEKYCLNRAEVCDFVNRVRDENPNIVFFRKEEIPDPTTEESVLVTITGWFNYNDTSSKPKKKQSKKEIKWENGLLIQKKFKNT